jgi:hypothetical protein
VNGGEEQAREMRVQTVELLAGIRLTIQHCPGMLGLAYFKLWRPSPVQRQPDYRRVDAAATVPQLDALIEHLQEARDELAGTQAGREERAA